MPCCASPQARSRNGLLGAEGGAQDRDYQLQEAFADGEVQIQFDGTVDLTA